MALSAARVQKRQNNPMLISVKMAASTTIYQGGGVMLNSSGLAIPAADTASCYLAGVAMETKTSDATTASYISVAASGVFNFKTSSMSQTSVGLYTCWSDDETVALIGGVSNDVPAGVCVAYNSDDTADILITGHGENW